MNLDQLPFLDSPSQMLTSSWFWRYSLTPLACTDRPHEVAPTSDQASRQIVVIYTSSQFDRKSDNIGLRAPINVHV